MTTLLSLLMADPAFAEAFGQVQSGEIGDADVVVQGTPVWIEMDEDVVLITSNSWTFEGFETMFEIQAGEDETSEMVLLTTYDSSVADDLMRRSSPNDPETFDILAACGADRNPSVPLRAVLGAKACTIPAVFRPMIDAPARFAGLTTGRPWQVELDLDPLAADALPLAA